MTYEDILFLIGFFLIIAFFVGCKHKPTTLFGWLAFAFLSFIVTPLIISTFNLVRLPDARSGNN